MKQTREQIKTQFDRDTANHTIKIHHDNGVYRHIEFSNNGSSICRLDITTWPNHLAVSGDMGDFMFTRTNDMFEFFRHRTINPGYWSEKCVAGKYEEWSQEKYHDLVKSYQEDCDPDIIYDALQCDGEWECVTFLNDNSDVFCDWWDSDLNDYTYHFIWCLYATITVIEKYDAIKHPAQPV